MNWVKYKLAILFFAAVVAVGVSVVLSQFNVMIRPAGPVSAFHLEGGGNSVYQVEFLGEKVGLELPANPVTGFITEKNVENGKAYIGKAYESLKDNNGQVLEKLLLNLKVAVGSIVSETISCFAQKKEEALLKEWLPEWLPVSREKR